MVGRILYVEGGGDGKALRTKCREGFRKLLERAGCTKHMPRIVACGGRTHAFHSFELLGRVDPARVAAASPWARRFFDHMREQP